ncbi:MAG TPA: hypothetical protein VHT75_13405 [Acidimicrobiales bacterium]|jgi:hypothetical protein|nr:hypothetical protein [Acidimicrobiales bacterium]
MSVWFSIEVFDGASSAALWSEAYGDALVESAFMTGAREWNWHRHSWGVVLELAFDDEEAWDRFRELPSVQAVLDAVPDPLTGLLVYRGRGGSAATWAPRPRRPLVGSGSAALPLPWGLWDTEAVDVFSTPIERRLAPALTACIR